MARRTLTLMLCISLLLALRVATHLLAMPVVAGVAGLAIARQTRPAEPPSVATSTRLPLMAAGHANTPVPLTPDARSNDSLARLEAFLIPDASATGNSGSNSTDEASITPVEDNMLATLRSYKVSLDKRASELDKRDKKMQEAEKKLQQRITELQQLEASIQQRLKDEAGIKNKKIKRLSGVYAGMRPDKAAPVIARMDLATVVRIFSLMDEKKVGKILSFLPAGKAVVISQALTRQISTVK